jgi:hypothetical protein
MAPSLPTALAPQAIEQHATPWVFHRPSSIHARQARLASDLLQDEANGLTIQAPTNFIE